MNFIIKLLLIVIVISFAALISCQKSPKSYCTPIIRLYKDTFQIKFNFLDGQTKKVGSEIVLDSIRNLVLLLNNKEFEQMTKTLNFEQIKNIQSPYVMLIYLDKILNEIDSIDIEDIAALEIYSIDNLNQLWFQLFLNTSNGFCEQKEFTCREYYLNSTASLFFINNIIPFNKTTKSNHSFFYVYNTTLENFKFSNKTANFLQEKIRNYEKSRTEK